MNWQRVVRPISLGGLGVHDLERTGLSLRLRWLWLSRTDSRHAWHDLDLQFAADERALFFASTTMQVGDGCKALFWEDRWLNGRSIGEVAPLLYACIPKRRRKLRTVADGLQVHAWARDIHGTLGLHEIGQYLLIWQAIEGMQLHDAPDQLLWKWMASGNYSASSAYLATFQGSTLCPAWKHIWKAWAPPRVKFFHWLASQNRCWTADWLARRGLQHHLRCLLCDQEPETMRHLLVHCPFAKQVWHGALAWLRLSCHGTRTILSSLGWWRQNKRRPNLPAKGWDQQRCSCHG